MPYSTSEKARAYRATPEFRERRRAYVTSPEVLAARKAYRDRPDRKLAVSAYHRARNARIKQEVVAAYGGRCRCCGESDPRFLTIGHVNGGGAAHRKEIGTEMCKWLRKNNFPQGDFELQCFNCNCGAHINKGICPHKESV
jgi:hypothetical protein